MRRFSWLALLGMLVLSRAALAQMPVPWPPDPHAIFAEGVVWRVMEDTDDAEAKTVTLAYGHDYQNYAVQLKNEETGITHLYPFPEKEPALVNAELQDDGRILVTTHYSLSDTRLKLFLLDPQTGVYQHVPIETVCEGRVIRAAAGEGKWAQVERSSLYQDQEPFLCQTETGEQRSPKNINFAQMAVYSTPDPSRVLLIEYNTSDYPIFVYNTETDTVTALGKVSEGVENMVSVCEWITDTKGLLCTEDQNRYYISRDYYEFDITQEDSVKHVFSGWPESIFALENPIRYFAFHEPAYFSYLEGWYMGENPCFLSIYDAEGLRTQTLGDACTPLLPQEHIITPFYAWGDHFYYLTQNDTALATLYRYDTEKEQASEPLLTREIESIISVSPDERYVVLVLDDNGLLDFQWIDAFCCSPAMEMAILDTHSGKIVYRSEKMGIYHETQVAWLDDNTLIVAVSDSYERIQTEVGADDAYLTIPGTTRRIDLEDESATSKITTEYSCVYDDPRGASMDLIYTLSYDGRQCFTENYVLDLDTFEVVPVINPNTPDGYWSLLDWNTDGTLAVSVISYERDLSITYRVTLP